MSVKIADVVIDFELYPRGSTDPQNVARLVMALEAGATLPPIVLDKKTMLLVDGLHRLRAHERLRGELAAVEVDLRTYRTEKEIFIDAMRLNATHGRSLGAYDCAHCAIKAERLKITAKEVADALNIPIARLEKLHRTKMGSVRRNGAGGRSVPVKRSARHMAGRKLTPAQADVMPKLGGNDQLFYVNQLLMLFDNDMLDLDNESMRVRLAALRSVLVGLDLKTADAA